VLQPTASPRAPYVQNNSKTKGRKG